MAVCIGCGVELINGSLVINLCGDPVLPNTTTGGLQCDPSSEFGCLKVVLNDSHAGCGLNASGGALNVDTCLNGGILCGATDDDPEDECIYINVQGQGAAACRALNTVDTSLTGPSQNPSPNCNGLVRTCDGLWAPPKIRSINFSCGQLGRGPGTLPNIIQNIGAQAADLPGPPFIDGFISPQNDAAYGPAGGQVIIVNAFEYDPCNPIDAMSWTAFNVGYVVNPGELWRWALWERVCGDGLPPANTVADPLTTSCNGVDWALQAIQYIDRRNEGTAAFETIQINDNSTWRFGRGAAPGDGARMEAMITLNRLQGVGPIDNTLFYANFQYRNMGHGYHTQTEQNCSFRDA